MKEDKKNIFAYYLGHQALGSVKIGIVISHRKTHINR